MALTFEWDSDKAAANLEKHGVGFTEASTVFRDPVSSTIPNSDHSQPEEVRELTIGHSHRSRLIVVAHCSRGRNIRIITARKATRRERKAYEEG